MALTITSIHNMLEPGADALGYEILTVEMAGGDSSILRIYIDSPNGITVEDCAQASHQFSAILDVEDPISSKYYLEVSSPGLDRPLSKPEHFKMVQGEQVKIRMRTLIDGRKRFMGDVVVADESAVTIKVEEGNDIELPYADMDRARVVPVFD